MDTMKINFGLNLRTFVCPFLLSLNINSHFSFGLRKNYSDLFSVKWSNWILFDVIQIQFDYNVIKDGSILPKFKSFTFLQRIYPWNNERHPYPSLLSVYPKIGAWESINHNSINHVEPKIETEFSQERTLIECTKRPPANEKVSVSLEECGLNQWCQLNYVRGARNGVE